MTFQNAGHRKDIAHIVIHQQNVSPGYKIESGTVTLEIGPVMLREVCGSAERTFRPVAQSKNLSFTIDLKSDLPVALQTDAQRLS